MSACFFIVILHVINKERHLHLHVFLFIFIEIERGGVLRDQMVGALISVLFSERWGGRLH